MLLNLIFFVNWSKKKKNVEQDLLFADIGCHKPQVKDNNKIL